MSYQGVQAQGCVCSNSRCGKHFPNVYVWKQHALRSRKCSILRDQAIPFNLYLLQLRQQSDAALQQRLTAAHEQQNAAHAHTQPIEPFPPAPIQLQADDATELYQPGHDMDFDYAGDHFESESVYDGPNDWLNTVENVETEPGNVSWPEEWATAEYGDDGVYDDIHNPSAAMRHQHFNESEAYDYLRDDIHNAGFDQMENAQQPAYSGNGQDWQPDGGALAACAYGDQEWEDWRDPHADTPQPMYVDSSGVDTLEGWGEAHGESVWPVCSYDDGVQNPGTWAEPYEDEVQPVYTYQDPAPNFEGQEMPYNVPERPYQEATPVQEPQPLFNPYDDGAEPAYIRIDTGDEVIYKYAAAGDVVQTAGLEKPRWEKWQQENEQKYDGGEWGRWITKEEWDDAYWMSTTKASQSSLRDLLQTSRYASKPPGFKTVKKLFNIIENELSEFGGPQFNVVDVRLSEAPLDQHVLAYRCTQQCGDHLFGTPRFDGHMSLAPIIKFGRDGIRRYDNVNTGDYWNLRQRALQAGTTLGAAIVMSDATQLSMHSGDVSAHGVYMSLANIDKSIREDISKGAWLLIGIIPKSNWDKTLSAMGNLSKDRRTALINLLNRRLFHRCMEIITRPFRRTTPHVALDPSGTAQLIQYELSVYGADLQEQCDAACITRNICPHCKAKAQKLGDPPSEHVRSSEQILADISKVLTNFHRIHGRYPNPLEFWDEGKKFDLNGVQRPFWRKLPNFDICVVLSPDILHGVHKCFFDHVHRWNLIGLGAEEYDTRLKAQPETPGERTFPQGVSRLKQLTGKDFRALERVHLAIVAHAPEQHEGGVGSQKLMRATRGMMDCAFLAQLPVHTEETLAAYEEAYQRFQNNKSVWLENKSKRGKKGKLTAGWAIPKQHIMGHIPDQVRLKGTCDNFNTETMEHLHVPFLKDGYRASNRKGWVRQIIRYIARRDIMRGYREFLEWMQATKRDGAEAMTDGLDNPDLLADDEEESNADIDNLDNGEEEDEDRYKAADDDGDDDETEGDEDDDDEDGEEEMGPEEGGWSQRGRAEDPDLDNPSQVPVELPPERAEPPESFQQTGPSVVDEESIDQTILAGRFSNSDIEEDGVSFPFTHLPLYRVAKRPSIRVISIAQVMQDFRFPKFLHHLQQHPYYALRSVAIDHDTPLSIWNSLSFQIPPSPYCLTEKKTRLYAKPDTDEKEQRWDPVLYVPTGSAGMRQPELEVLHDYSVGRLALIFALRPTDDDPEPLLMAYIQRFTSIPRSPSGTSGFYAVAKAVDRGSPRFETIAASQLARPCPLSPLFKGPATRGVTGNRSLEHYQKFYINKYCTPNDFFFFLRN